MGINQGGPVAGLVPDWVVKAHRRDGTTPAFDAARTLHAPAVAGPEQVAAWRARLSVPVPPGRPLPAVSVQALLDEVDRLTALVALLAPIVDKAVLVEACWWDQGLRYPLVKLADDAFIAWVGSCDAPTGRVMTKTEALQTGWSPARVASAREPTPDGYLHNRAGPHEASITVAAIRQAFASEESYAAFRLTPDLVQCYTTSGREDPVTGDWDQTTVYWTPWEPADMPASLPDGWADRF